MSCVRRRHLRLALRGHAPQATKSESSAHDPAGLGPAGLERGWLVTRGGRPYARAAMVGAVGFRIEWSRRRSRWAPANSADGPPLMLPLGVSHEAFARAVVLSGVYRLIPIDEHDQPVGVPPKMVTLR